MLNTADTERHFRDRQKNNSWKEVAKCKFRRVFDGVLIDE